MQKTLSIQVSFTEVRNMPLDIVVGKVGKVFSSISVLTYTGSLEQHLLVNVVLL